MCIRDSSCTSSFSFSSLSSSLFLFLFSVCLSLSLCVSLSIYLSIYLSPNYKSCEMSSNFNYDPSFLLHKNQTKETTLILLTTLPPFPLSTHFLKRGPIIYRTVLEKRCSWAWPNCAWNASVTLNPMQYPISSSSSTESLIMQLPRLYGRLP